MAKAAGLSEQRLGRRNIFSPAAKIALMVLKAYTGFSDRQLVEHLNGNIHYQMFCGIMIDPAFPITNYKKQHYSLSRIRARNRKTEIL